MKNASQRIKDLSRYIGGCKDNPFLAALLNAGEEIPTEKPKGPKKDYIGEYIPTIFDIGENNKEIPYNRYARLRIKTDAVNNYLTRAKDKGEFRWTSSKLVQINQYSLKDGFLPIRIEPVADAKPGNVDTITFELTRPNQDPLKADLKITIGEFEEAKTNPPGTPKLPTKQALKLPERKYIPKEDWSKENWVSPSGKRWTGLDIAEVAEDQEGITVYINKEPDVLAEFPKRNPKYASGDMMAMVQKRFFASIYLYAIAMFFEMKNETEQRDWAIPNSLKAISKFILDLAFTNRAEQVEED